MSAAINGFNKAKIKTFIDEWTKIEEDAASKIGAIMSKVKTAKDNVLQHAEDIGIKRKVMRSVINEVKLRAKADGLRDAFADSVEDEEVIDQRDRVASAAGLTLFEAAGVDAKEAKKPKAEKAPKKTKAKPPLDPVFADDKTGDKGGGDTQH